jgi:hypothetical protein
MVPLIVISLAAYCIIAMLFKTAAGRTAPDRLVVVALTVVTLAAALTMLIRGEWGGTWLGAAIALGAGALFYIASIYRVRALNSTPVSLVFAVTNLDLVVSGSVALFIPAFGQPLSAWHLLALVVAGAAILLGTQISGRDRISPDTFRSLAALSASALGFVVYARLYPGALLFFILLDHLAGVLLNGRSLRHVQRAEVVWGGALGITMFIGFWALLQALTISGDRMTLVLLALSMKTPVIALLAVPLFGERVTIHKVGAIGLATLAVMMWEIG